MKIKNLSTIPATGKLDNQFIGIRIRDNQIEFHYPETYELEKDDVGLRRDILAILRTVSLAKTMTSDRSEYYQRHREFDGFPIGAYLWIISDYLSFGRYENKERNFERGIRGRINWKRTFSHNPIISDGNVIYSDFVSERKMQRDNLLTEIYNFCVQKATDDIGWLFNVSFDSDGTDYRKLFNKNRYIHAVSEALSRTFDDQKRLRLQNMASIITGVDENLIRTREVIYGVDSYEYVYERMVDSLFSNVRNIRDFYPNATWNLVLENKRVDSSNLRPDTVLIRKDQKKVYILDAKYYRYGTTFNPSDMPDTTSIQKQITYGEYVKRVKNGEFVEAYSAFILPYSKTKNIHNERFHENMEFIGIGTPKWMDSEDEKHRRIVAILLDTNYLINRWVSKNEDDANQLITMIEEHLGR